MNVDLLPTTYLISICSPKFSTTNKPSVGNRIISLISCIHKLFTFYYSAYCTEQAGHSKNKNWSAIPAIKKP